MAAVLVVACVALAVGLWRHTNRVAAGYTNNNKGVLVVMFSTPNIVPQYAGLAERANKAYAARHGYDFKHHVRPASHQIPQWEKVSVIREALQSHNTVFWIDSDAAFNQHDVPLDKWMASPADIVGCTDYPNGPYSINTGTLLVKSTPWSRKFFDLWWSMRTVPKYSQWANEQEALHDLILQDVHGCASSNKVQIEPARAFNSAFEDLAHGDRSTFVLHFMAMDSKYRRQELQALCTRVGA